MPEKLPVAFDWSRAVMESRRSLPHVRQSRTVYFVTYRTADSIPADLVVQWGKQFANEQELGVVENKQRGLARRVEKYLDCPQGECLLAEAECRRIIVENLLNGDGQRYLLDAYAVMPNHVHVLVMPTQEESLTRIVADWKRYSARMLGQRRGRTGAIWAAEAFDHIVRDLAGLQRFRAYIETNPEKVPPGHACAGRGSFAEVTGL